MLSHLTFPNFKIHNCNPQQATANIDCDSSEILRTKSIKHLGVVIDEKLTFNELIALSYLQEAENSFM